MSYRAPVEDVAFMLARVAGFRGAADAGVFGDLADDVVQAILVEAGRFAADVLAPLNGVGDRHPPALADGAVTTHPDWRAAYRALVEAGWQSLTGSPDDGGQGLPFALAIAVHDLFNQANPAFAINLLLTAGAVEALEAHGSAALRAAYLPHLVSGRWTGTMNLTEPQAGSDLAALRTRAERRDDGSYRLYGQKIFITYGEHDLAENIVHLVLARLPDAPAGTRGLSLFLVPKFVPGADGALGARNDVWCRGLEHKLGLHSSPTCTMVFGEGAGAVGYLVGDEHQGLRCMFTMMNAARLGVGIQGVGVAARAFQHAAAYAAERRQGSATAWTGEGMAPIAYHPDVARMLLLMRTLTDASRAICYACGVAIDRAQCDVAQQRPAWQARADLLTPVAKAFSTDVGVEVASIGVQVHGGMGFIEESGAAQFYRDARIFPIYEGTNGIQAIDLVTRKLRRDGGAAARAYFAELRQIADETRASGDQMLSAVAATLTEAVEAVDGATTQLLDWQAGGQTQSALAGASVYLRAFGLTVGGAYLAKAALEAHASNASPDATARSIAARFFADHRLRDVPALAATVCDGSASITAQLALLPAE